MSKARVSVRLATSGMGDVGGDVSADMFAEWVAFVAHHLSARCGFDVDVDAYPFTNETAKDHLAGNDEDVAIVDAALEALWEGWCHEGAPGVEDGEEEERAAAHDRAVDAGGYNGPEN